MTVVSQRACRTAVPKQNHPRRNKSKVGTAATLRSRPRGAVDHAVRVVHGVCCLAGSASLIDDLRAELRTTAAGSGVARLASDRPDAQGLTINYVKCRENPSDRVRRLFGIYSHNKPNWTDSLCHTRRGYLR